jgi:ATP-dependent Lon protease
MCFVDDSGRVSAIGTTLEIQDFLVESSGRMYVTNKGIERFRVTNVVKKQPVLVCDVEVLPEDDDQSEEVRSRVQW